MHRNATQPNAGSLLLSDFQTVFASLAMTEAAKYEAAQSENQFMYSLAAMGSSNYLNPGTIDPTVQPDITRNSLDVHIKKVQAQQMESLSANQLTQVIQQAKAAYIGKKATIVPLDPKNTSIESVWFNEQTGYYNGQVKKRISGSIEDVVLDQNLLILKPTLKMRMINPNLQNYLVYVINPVNFQPMISCLVT